jgi:hypothetical protein
MPGVAISGELVLGQGVVLFQGGTRSVLHPDGTMASLPSTVDLGRLDVVYPDGKVCGRLASDGSQLRCRLANGTDVLSGAITCDQILGGTATKLYGISTGKLCLVDVSGATPVQQDVLLGNLGISGNTLQLDFVQAADGAAYLYHVRSPPVGTNYTHTLVSIDNALTSTTNLLGGATQILAGCTHGRVVADQGVFDVIPLNPIGGVAPKVVRVPRP